MFGFQEVAEGSLSPWTPSVCDVGLIGQQAYPHFFTWEEVPGGGGGQAGTVLLLGSTASPSVRLPQRWEGELHSCLEEFFLPDGRSSSPAEELD